VHIEGIIRQPEINIRISEYLYKLQEDAPKN
jgi:hypothetical protein